MKILRTVSLGSNFAGSSIKRVYCVDYCALVFFILILHIISPLSPPLRNSRCHTPLVTSVAFASMHVGEET